MAMIRLRLRSSISIDVSRKRTRDADVSLWDFESVKLFAQLVELFYLWRSRKSCHHISHVTPVTVVRDSSLDAFSTYSETQY